MGNRATRINIDLGQYKQPWLAYCRARGETPSAMFRQMTAQRMAEVETTAVAVVAPAPKARKQLTLTAEEHSYVIASARRMGMRDGDWIVSLIRTQMTRQVQLGAPELEMLGRSNLALLSIGRNLNQLARATNAGGALIPTELAAVLGALRVLLTSHVDGVAQLLSANRQQWGIT